MQLEIDQLPSGRELDELLLTLYKGYVQPVFDHGHAGASIAELGDLAYVLRKLGYRWVNNDPDRDPRRGFWLQPDVYVVAIDETDMWHLGETDMQQVQRIEGVYFFDRNIVTHLGSLQGSYMLHGLEHRAQLKPGTSEDDESRIQDLVADEPCEDDYFSTSTVDQILCHYASPNVSHIGCPAEANFEELDGHTDEERYESLIETLREEFHANAPI